MKKVDLGQTISIFANVVVIAGIVFLGVELRQNNELLNAEARINYVEMTSETWNQLSENPEIIALLVKDRNAGALSGEEELRLNSFWMKVLLQLQRRYQELPDSIEWIQGQRRNIDAYGSLLRTRDGGGDGSRSGGKDNFESGFIEFFEKNVIGR